MMINYKNIGELIELMMQASSNLLKTYDFKKEIFLIRFSSRPSFLMQQYSILVKIQNGVLENKRL